MRTLLIQFYSIFFLIINIFVGLEAIDFYVKVVDDHKGCGSNLAKIE